MLGKSVSHYHVVEALGAGGMGVVYKTRDEKLGRLVDLKFLPKELSQDHEAMERMPREDLAGPRRVPAASITGV